MRSLALCLLLLPATASASVGDEYGDLVDTLINDAGFTCGRIADIIESTDPGWDCAITGQSNTNTQLAVCLNILNASCADVGPNDDDGDGYTIDDGDCADDDAAINPGAFEVCDGADNNCDGAADDDSAIDAVTWYRDIDGDGYGSMTVSADACEEPLHFVADNTDCNDRSAAVNPGADEVCDEVFDNDCDGTVDEDGAVDALDWYGDDDGDGFGENSDVWSACVQPAGYEPLGDDCDDSNDWTYPGAIELCDGERNDCDDAGWADDAGTASLEEDGTGEWYDFTPTMSAGSYASPANFMVVRHGTLNICEGTWYTEMQIQTDLEVLGFDGRDKVTLSGGNRAVPLEVLSSVDVTVRDITVTDGYSADFGGGLRFNGVGDITLDNIEVTSSYAVQHAGGVLIYNADSATVTDVTITNNASGDSAGGLSLYSVDAVTVARADVSNNDAASYAGGLYLYDLSAADISDSTFNDNVSETGAGATITQSSGVSIADSEFDGNYASYYGGAAWISFSEVVMDGVNIEQNDSEYGGGFFVEGTTSDLTLNTCDLIGNGASANAGAVYMYEGIMDVSSGDFAANSPNDIYAGASYNYAYGESFTCSSTGCF